MKTVKRRHGNVRERSKGVWQVKFDVASTDGKRHTRYATVRGSQKDAEKELRRLLHAADTGNLPDPSTATVAAYLRQWLSSAIGVSPKTRERYGELAENQILPHLGGIKVQALKPEHVQAWHATLLQTGLAARTIGNAHRVLRRMLGNALRNGTLTRNVATIHSPPKAEEVELEILDASQVEQVLAALDGQLRTIVALALATGMRRGELLGLQWGDVDLDRATVTVERSVEETRKQLRLKSPKTRRGRRSVTLPQEAVALLRAYRLEMMEFRVAAGKGKIVPETIVFGDANGELRRPSNLSKSWQHIRDRLKLPRVPFHAFRHTHASMLIRAGVDILTISRRLGHSKAAITLDVYGHLMHGADAAAAQAIAGLLGGGTSRDR